MSETRAPAEDVLAALVELGGAGATVVELDAGEPPPLTGAGDVRIGVHRAGPRPAGALEAFDILLSADAAAPRPWVASGDLDATLADLVAQIETQPTAATVAAQVFRATLKLGFDESLALESLGYSMLLASGGLRAWRAANPPKARAEGDEARVLVDRTDAVIRIRLNRPARRNAFDARMRDELAEALECALLDPDQAPVLLSGEGPSFSAGGDLDEFGQALDVGVAHLIRTVRAPVRLLARLGGRATARVHGACIGAGIEVPAAAAHVTAAPDAVFRLPEVAMGLIPGAGGTASIPRRIGRRRACYMAISGATIDARTALAWGLLDEVDP